MSGRGDALTLAKKRAQDFTTRRQWRDAIAEFDKIFSLEGRSAAVLAQRGRVLRAQGRIADALADLESAAALNPGDCALAAEVAYCSMQLCLWDELPRKTAAVLDGIEAGGYAEPLIVATLPSSGEQQLKTARRCFARFATSARPLERLSRSSGEKIRLGYISADFYDHATSQLIVNTLEIHDRDEFEIVAYGVGYPKADAMHRRVVAAVDRFDDVSALTDVEIAARVRADRVHIGIDLTGYTGMMRAGIFAHGVAPIQVNYLTYPGTLGTERVHYLIGDPIVTPIKHRGHFCERIVTLPHCYQPNDRTKRNQARVLSRAEAGLPATGFVFCNFGISAKIAPDVFAVWMRLLQAVEGSVLWLMESDAAASRHLRIEAQIRGVSPERLVFAPRAPVATYLGRHSHANLILDTLNYNGHTTGSDALLMGVPFVTRCGETFAGRVGASLLSAVGLPELIADNLKEYERLALDLARQPQRLEIYRRRLADGALISPLFDTKRYTRNLESAFREMWRRYERGSEPDHITVSDVG